MACGWLSTVAVPVLVPVIVVGLGTPPSGPAPPVSYEVPVVDSVRETTGDGFSSRLPRGGPGLYGQAELPADECPLSVDVACPSHEWPYSVAVVITSGAGTWRVSVDVVSSDGAGLTEDIVVHERVTPSKDEEPYVVAPGLARRVAFFFDPQDTESLNTLRRAHLAVRWGRSQDSMAASAIYPLELPVWDGLAASGFRLERDAYRFENVDECYGMCATAALYYGGDLRRPDGATSTFGLTREEACTAIHCYQVSHANSLGTIAARVRDDSLSPADLSWLELQLGAGYPVVAWLARSRVGGAHAVLIRGLWRNSVRDTGMLTIYDPDHSYASTLGFNLDAFRVMPCELSTGRLLLGEYSGIAFGRALVMPDESGASLDGIDVS